MSAAMYGYDGNGYNVGDRVELHPAHDLWMQGARYGVVIGRRTTPKDRVHLVLDKLPNRVFSCSEDSARFLCRGGTE